jgi:TetR/AcrR family transcriptional repressor of nem operon
MCGILAAEYRTLPEAMREAVIGFFDENQRWLANLLAEGEADGTLTFTGSPDEIASSVLSTLEGAMLVARPYGEAARFDATAQLLVAQLSS